MVRKPGEVDHSGMRSHDAQPFPRVRLLKPVPKSRVLCEIWLSKADSFTKRLGKWDSSPRSFKRRSGEHREFELITPSSSRYLGETRAAFEEVKQLRWQLNGRLYFQSELVQKY